MYRRLFFFRLFGKNFTGTSDLPINRPFFASQKSTFCGLFHAQTLHTDFRRLLRRLPDIQYFPKYDDFCLFFYNVQMQANLSCVIYLLSGKMTSWRTTGGQHLGLLGNIIKNNSLKISFKKQLSNPAQGAHHAKGHDLLKLQG